MVSELFNFETFINFLWGKNSEFETHEARPHVLLGEKDVILTHRSQEFTTIPNQELSVLYEGPTLNYGGQLSLYVPYMLRVDMAGDLAHLQLSDLQGETRPICRTSDLQGERMLVCRT